MDPRSIEAANTRAVMLKDEGRVDEARDYLHGGLRAAKLHLGDDHPTTLSIMTNLSALLVLTGKLGEALPLSLETLQARRTVLGDEHEDTLNSMINLGTLHEQRDEVAQRGDGHLNEAIDLLAEELEGHVRRFGRHCGSYLPQDTRTCARIAGEAIAALPGHGGRASHQSQRASGASTTATPSRHSSSRVFSLSAEWPPYTSARAGARRCATRDARRARARIRLSNRRIAPSCPLRMACSRALCVPASILSRLRSREPTR